MRMVVGIGGERDAAALKEFLKGATGVTEALAMAVIPKPSRLPAIVGNSVRRWQNHVSRLQEIEQSHASLMLASFKEDVQRPGLNIETSVVVGAPAEELIKLARRSRADFILATRRHGEQKEASDLGQVASRAARYAPCSVILLDPQRPVPARIVFATDGSPQAQKAGAQLRALGLGESTRLFICTVAQTMSPAFLRTGRHGYDDYRRIMSEIHEQEREAARQLLTSAAAPFKDTGFRVRQLAYDGDTTDIILKVIREQEADMLALGAKGVSAAAEFLLGSVTLKMLNRAPCSILVAR